MVAEAVLSKDRRTCELVGTVSRDSRGFETLSQINTKVQLRTKGYCHANLERLMRMIKNETKTFTILLIHRCWHH